LNNLEYCPFVHSIDDGTFLREEEKITLKIRLKSASKERPQVISLNIFKLQDMIILNMTLEIKANYLLIGLN